MKTIFGFLALYVFLALEIDQLDLSADKITVTESGCSEDLRQNTAVNETSIIDAGIVGALAQTGRRIDEEFERFFTEIELNIKFTLIKMLKNANAAIKTFIMSVLTTIEAVTKAALVAVLNALEAALRAFLIAVLEAIKIVVKTLLLLIVSAVKAALKSLAMFIITGIKCIIMCAVRMVLETASNNTVQSIIFVLVQICFLVIKRMRLHFTDSSPKGNPWSEYTPEDVVNLFNTFKKWREDPPWVVLLDGKILSCYFKIKI